MVGGSDDRTRERIEVEIELCCVRPEKKRKRKKKRKREEKKEKKSLNGREHRRGLCSHSLSEADRGKETGRKGEIFYDVVDDDEPGVGERRRASLNQNTVCMRAF